MEESLGKTPKKLPKWLEIDPRFGSLSDRPRLGRLDELEEERSGEGTALDTVKHRPSYRLKVLKKITRALAEAEEWKEFAEKKSSEGKVTPGLDLFQSLEEEVVD